MGAYTPQTWADSPSTSSPLSAARLQYMEDGIAALGVWVAYTPTLGNFTLGNGTMTARWTQIGKTVLFSVRIVLGSTSAVTGVIQIGTPVTAAAAGWQCIATLADTGTNFYYAFPLSVTTLVELYVLNTAGTYATPSNTSATVPFTWTSTDVITVAGFFEAA